MCLHHIESWVCWGLSVGLYSTSYTVKCGARACMCLHVSRAKHSSVCVCTFWELDVSAHTEGWECGCMRLNVSKAGSALQGAVQLHQGCVHSSGLCLNSCPVCMHLFSDGVLVWYCNKIGLQFPKGLMSLTACQENKDKPWLIIQLHHPHTQVYCAPEARKEGCLYSITWSMCLSLPSMQFAVCPYSRQVQIKATDFLGSLFLLG